MIGQNQDNRNLFHISWHGRSSYQAITRDSKFRKYGFDPFRIRDMGGFTVFHLYESASSPVLQLSVFFCVRVRCHGLYYYLCNCGP